VVHAEAWELLPRARYHHEFLGDASSERQSYFASAWQRLRDTPLLFLDPDKGLEVPSVAYGRRTSASYLYWHEVDEAYRLGHSLVLYQHFRRTKRGPFVTTLTDSLRRRLAGCRVESFRSASAVYLVAARPEHAASLQRGCDLVRHRWQRQIQCTRGDKPVTSP
jgi:hypothetical protein